MIISVSCECCSNCPQVNCPVTLETRVPMFYLTDSDYRDSSASVGTGEDASGSSVTVNHVRQVENVFDNLYPSQYNKYTWSSENFRCKVCQ